MRTTVSNATDTTSNVSLKNGGLMPQYCHVYLNTAVMLDEHVKGARQKEKTTPHS